MTDLGQVLHMVGGTAAAFMIFFLPGMFLINAAIVKESAPEVRLSNCFCCPAKWLASGKPHASQVFKFRKLDVSKLGCWDGDSIEIIRIEMVTGETYGTCALRTQAQVRVVGC